MKNKKITLWVIIFLLILFLPITIFSTITHYQNLKPVDENPTHELKHNGKLYFYQDDILLGTYTCQNFNEYCDYADSKVNSVYSLNERIVEENTKLPISSGRFVFLKDSKTKDLAESNILLYDLNLERVIGEYKEVKNYGIGIEGDYYLIKNQNDSWGIVSFNEGINLNIPFKYDYIGLVDNVNSETNKVDSAIFAASIDGMWQLIDINGATFTDKISNEIISYNNEYIILKNNSYMSLVNYSNEIQLNNLKHIDFFNKYISIIDSNNLFYLYDTNTNQIISNSYLVNSIEDISLEIVDNKIQIAKNGNIEETIAID